MENLPYLMLPTCNKPTVPSQKITDDDDVLAQVTRRVLTKTEFTTTTTTAVAEKRHLKILLRSLKLYLVDFSSLISSLELNIMPTSNL